MLRKVTISLFLLNSVLLAHYFGGAEFRVTKYFVLLGFVTFYIIPEELEVGPNLAYFVLIFQGLGHVSLELAGASPTRMSLNHLLAGFLTYHFVKQFDSIVKALCDWFTPFLFLLFKSPLLKGISRTAPLEKFKIIEGLKSYFVRGPPFSTGLIKMISA